MYVCGLGDVVALFLEKGESRHATALTRSPKSFFERGLFISIRDRYYFFRLRNGGDAGCELTEERSDAWEPYIANPEA